MRHAFASRMISRGITSTVLASLMGHESSVITERRYIHLFDQQRTDEAVRQAMSSGFARAERTFAASVRGEAAYLARVTRCPSF